MFNALGPLKSLVVRVKVLHIDNGVFRLHYQFTFLILLAFSILVTHKQYIGDPIDCSTRSLTIRENLLDQYCWVSSNHTVYNACRKKLGTDVIYSCVDKDESEEEVIAQQYYQWVSFVLFLQAIMFYFPHYVWKIWESGRLKALTMDLPGPLDGEDVQKHRIAALTAYFKVSLHRHNFYAYRYSFCEFLNLVNVIGQMFMTNKFLGGAFLDYGTDVIQFTQLDQTDRTDPMIAVFPRVTKCVFSTAGASGVPQKHSAVCVLSINIINEKIYVVLWFWFIILAIISGLAIVYRLVTIFSSNIRYRLLKAKATSTQSRVVMRVAKRVQFGDWFLVYLLSQNMNSYNFRDVADIINEQLGGYKENTADDTELSL